MDLIKEFGGGFVYVVMGLLPIANPFSTAPMFVALSTEMSEAERAKVALSACIYMVAILLVFNFAGALILGFFWDHDSGAAPRRRFGCWVYRLPDVVSSG